ncbi:hypothetical protein [Alcanivorax quisquiliarum]|uniref:Uncharacterized protein n=1 Tax=Alcanivorax quisquiliarum TaxID=2933565 RepID=A0ABT0E4A9_9GAMM|nr:hypothetical protein [Alcanivorax quisquiliarum]MCK0536653.1 hypothetical protein [Alcanivorax quisquiliarum]
MASPSFRDDNARLVLRQMLPPEHRNRAILGTNIDNRFPAGKLLAGIV